MRGISFIVPGELQLSDLRITVRPDGGNHMETPTVTLRTDMWPQWALEAVDGAAAARAAAEKIPAAMNPVDEGALARIVPAELRASLRALGASAFAHDAFYASIAARADERPAPTAGTRRTARAGQIVTLLRHELRLTNDETKRLRQWLRDLFRFRDWAVHPGARFQTPVLRPDLDAAVDWHFFAFSATNAENAVRTTVTNLGHLVDKMSKARSEGVRKTAEAARAAIVEVRGYLAATLPVPPEVAS